MSSYVLLPFFLWIWLFFVLNVDACNTPLTSESLQRSIKRSSILEQHFIEFHSFLKILNFSIALTGVKRMWEFFF
jgi:hypothetical protein